MRMAVAGSLLLSSILLAASSQWNSLPLQGDEDHGWTPLEASDGDVGTYVVYRTVTSVERIVVRGEPFIPRYPIAPGRLMGLQSTSLDPDTNVVAIPDLGDGDDASCSERMLTSQMLDAARLACAPGAEVAVVIDRERNETNESGCERATLV